MMGQKDFDQRDQRVNGSQTNIREANAPTFSGKVGVVNVFPRKKPPIARLPFVPDPPPDFTGRDEELKELQAKFEAGTSIIGLRGIGGVGKAALALKLVESLKDSYPDGQIMVDMRGTTDPRSPMEAMSFVIRSYHREEKTPESEDETRLRYLEVLNGRRTLLLLDNALDDKQVQKLIPPKNCGLIITSRRTIKIPGLFKKNLDVLKPGEALALLLNVCCPAAEKTRKDPAWPEIARLCGYLPLALRAAASYLANSEDISPAGYALDLKDEKSRLEKIGEQGVDMSVDASFGLNFQKFEPRLRQTFLDLSVFPGDFDSFAEEQICQDEEHRSLSELVRWSFVDYKPQDQNYGRYSLHDLARLFASARQSDDSKAMVSQRHCSYYRELLAAADKLYLQGGKSIQEALALFDREDENIVSGYAWAANNAGVSSPPAELCMRYPNAGAYMLDLRLHPMKRISWLEAALAAARKLKDRAMQGVHLGNLGNAYVALGQARKAIECYEQAVVIARGIWDRRNEGVWLGGLGIAYKNLGEAGKAIEYYEQALTIASEIGDRRGEGNALGNLGLAHADLGEARKAIEYYKQRLTIAKEIGDRRGEGNVLGNLGMAYADLGETGKAIEYYKQHRAISREIGERRGEGNALGNLGNAYADLGEAGKAIDYYEMALAISREIGDRRGEGVDLGNLGQAYIDLGQTRKAIEYLQQALAIAREIGDKRNEGVWLGDLGIAYKNLGEPRKAIEFCEQQLVITRDIGDRRGEANALFNSSLTLHQLGEHSEAIEKAEDALQIYEQIESPVADRVKQQLAEWRW